MQLSLVWLLIIFIVLMLRCCWKTDGTFYVIENDRRLHVCRSFGHAGMGYSLCDSQMNECMHVCIYSERYMHGLIKKNINWILICDIIVSRTLGAEALPSFSHKLVIN